MNKYRLIGAFCLAVSSFTTVPSYAALIGVLPATPGGMDWQAYHDDVADLTWLANANAGAGSSYDDGGPALPGEMTWAHANAWAASLDINGVTGWRLPTTLQPDSSCSNSSPYGPPSNGDSCAGSEMGNMFYNVLGGQANTSIATTHNSNYDLFSNVQSSYYWSSTQDVYYPDPDFAWYFYFGLGNQYSNNESFHYYAWAVHSGNVVPLPAALWLFGSGLIGLLGLAKRKR